MIPFNKPYYTGHEAEYIQDAISRGKISGDGYYTGKASDFMKCRFGTPKALFVTSCSAALDMAASLLELKAGDEVIMPSYNFVSCANSVLSSQPQIKIVFAEIEPETMNIDPEDIIRKITDKTRAIFVVHYAGIACNMDSIMEIAEKYGLKVIEDAAQAVNAKYKGRFLGTFGDIGCYSFHESKNYTCGEGGALLINNTQLAERAEIIREKGTNRARFFRGEVDKYSWVDIGSSYLASDILAAFLWAQLEMLDEINVMRKDVFDYYYNKIKPLELSGSVRLPVIPEGCETNYHMFYLLFNSETERNEAMDILKEAGIMAVFHYVPLHISHMGKKLGYNIGDLPVTEDYSNRLLRLPMYADLQKSEQDGIIEKLFDYFKD